MNATVRMIRATSHKPPFRNPTEPAAMTKPSPERLRLMPIPWGKRNEQLGKALCQQIVEATPPTVIHANTITHARLRRCLRSLGIHH